MEVLGVLRGLRGFAPWRQKLLPFHQFFHTFILGESSTS